MRTTRKVVELRLRGRRGIDPFVLARELGLTLHPRARHGASLRGSRLFYNGKLSLDRQRALISRTLASLASRVIVDACKPKPPARARAVAAHRRAIA